MPPLAQWSSPREAELASAFPSWLLARGHFQCLAMWASPSACKLQVEKAIKRVCWEDEAIILHNLIASMAPSHLCYALLVKSKPQIVTAIERRGFDKNMKPENLGPWRHLSLSSIPPFGSSKWPYCRPALQLSLWFSPCWGNLSILRGTELQPRPPPEGTRDHFSLLPLVFPVDPLTSTGADMETVKHHCD